MSGGRQSSPVIFDLDNTLVDRDRFFGEWAEAFVQAKGLDAVSSLAILREADEDGAAPRTLFFEQMRARFGLEAPVETLVEGYWRDQMGRYRCDDQTTAGLRLLKQSGYKLGIATNGGPRQIDKIKACGLDGLVDAFCVSAIVGYAKPDPRLFAAVAEQSGASLSRAWVVGDRPESDIAEAVAIGARSVWMRRGQEWTEPDFAPTAVANTAAEAVRLILSADVVAP
jgi:putative hydrolase of the HAD superfamily